jgi:hypothetical protein
MICPALGFRAQSRRSGRPPQADAITSMGCELADLCCLARRGKSAARAVMAGWPGRAPWTGRDQAVQDGLVDGDGGSPGRGQRIFAKKRHSGLAITRRIRPDAARTRQGVRAGNGDYVRLAVCGARSRGGSCGPVGTLPTAQRITMIGAGAGHG